MVAEALPIVFIIEPRMVSLFYAHSLISISQGPLWYMFLATIHVIPYHADQIH